MPSSNAINDRLHASRVEFETPSSTLAIVSLVGEHDLADYEPLQQTLALATSRRRHVIVDLSACEFIDSTVISLLLHAQGEVVSDRGRFAVVIPPGPGAVRRVAELMQLESLFPVYASLENAQLTVHTASEEARTPPAAAVPAGPDYFPA
jgi:anti-anti-sigma factor